ncbi:MAG: TetR/AcrR family transcriptional regulator [Myxococcaceae bacterium]|jgi:AcrR family transcriptional regulator|nr:TetR/AcrR family transcriptional regulator [Myxococcaceae bacterium]
MTDSSPLRKQPKQARSRALVQSILEAAGDLLGRTNSSPDDIPLQKIAERAGVGIGSVYDYFANGEGVWSGFLGWITERNFAALEEKASGGSFVEKLPELLDGTLDLYLGAPARTRGVAMTIVRFGWVKRVVLERDRFAALLASRLCAEHPGLAPERARLGAEVLCDAVMGVVMGELWRERDEAGARAVRAEVRALVTREVAAMVGSAHGPAK